MLIMRKRLAAMAMVGTMLATGIKDSGCASGSAPKEEVKRQNRQQTICGYR